MKIRGKGKKPWPFWLLGLTAAAIFFVLVMGAILWSAVFGNPVEKSPVATVCRSGNDLVLDGIITGDIRDKTLDLISTLNGSSSSTIYLNSPGGDTGAARGLARQINREGISTAASHASKCMSACVILFVSGVRRVADPNSEFGFHSALFYLLNRPVVQPFDRSMRHSMLPFPNALEKFDRERVWWSTEMKTMGAVEMQSLDRNFTSISSVTVPENCKQKK